MGMIRAFPVWISVSTSNPFIHGSEPAREQRDRIRLFDETQLASEEIVELDELRIALDGFIGALFKRQPDIQSESVVPAPSLLRSSHDSLAGPCDGHIPGFRNPLPKFLRRQVFRLVRQRSRRTENRYLLLVAIGVEDLVGIPHLSKTAVHQLEVANAEIILADFERSDDEFLDEGMPTLAIGVSNELLHALIQSRIPGRPLCW